MATTGGSKTVKTTETAFDLIEHLMEEDGGRVTELAAELDLAKSTVHRHLSTLAQRGYVVNDGGHYRVGSRFVRISEYVRNRRQAYVLAKDLVRELADETGERAQFMVEEHGHAVYIHQATGSHAVKTDSGVGKWGPLHASAAGKAILSEMPAERVDEVVETRGLEAFTEHTITDREALAEELAAIRERQYSYNNQEYIEGLRAVGVPVSKASGETIGAFSVAGPSHRLKGTVFRETVPDLLLGVANELELNVAYS